MTDVRKRINRRQFLETSIKTSVGIATAPLLSTGLSGCGESGSFPYDTVLKGGLVFDGTGNAPVITDIGIKGDKIIQTGSIDAPAGQVIDAEGLAVMPGFIDVHTHCDLTFIKSGWKRHLSWIMPSWKGNRNYIGQGVTTVVTGNCGWGFGDIDQWYGSLDRLGFGTNVYHLAPHGVIREALFGPNQPAELNRSQMALMKKRIEAELEKGAIGVSTGLEYAPGLLTPPEELIELNRIVARYGRVYATHIRNESGALNPATGRIWVEQAIEEAIEVGRQTGVRVEISHLKLAAPFNGNSAALILDPIERARAQGLKITADQYPYAAGSTIISILMPPAFRAAQGIKDQYKTRQGRSQVKKAILEVFSYMGADKILITMCNENQAYEGKTLAEIGEMENKSPADIYTDLVSGDSVPIGVFFAQDMSVVKEIMTRDYILTGSDGWTVPKGMTTPHPRTYGTFPRKLGKFCREDKLIDASACIRSMTSLPAKTFCMKDRGEIKSGFYADLVTIDMEKVMDRATYLAPHQYAAGITHVMVNGKFALKDNEFTGDRSGRTIRS
ncbi:MAG: D-aminoacylase [Desulfobacter sp.]|nr:MAG: D-aminoacylase [Desulfobacter sp.]